MCFCLSRCRAGPGVLLEAGGLWVWIGPCWQPPRHWDPREEDAGRPGLAEAKPALERARLLPGHQQKKLGTRAWEGGGGSPPPPPTQKGEHAVCSRLPSVEREVWRGGEAHTGS